MEGNISIWIPGQDPARQAYPDDHIRLLTAIVNAPSKRPATLHLSLSTSGYISNAAPQQTNPLRTFTLDTSYHSNPHKPHSFPPSLSRPRLQIARTTQSPSHSPPLPPTTRRQLDRPSIPPCRRRRKPIQHLRLRLRLRPRLHLILHPTTPLQLDPLPIPRRRRRQLLDSTTPIPRLNILKNPMILPPHKRPRLFFELTLSDPSRALILHY